MKRLFLALLLALTPTAAQAQIYEPVNYELFYVNFNPYYREPVGGPFTFSQCLSVKSAAGYVPGGMYECQLIL